MDFTNINKAGITQSELAHLCQVTRQTAHGWVSKNRTPHRVYHAKLAKLDKAAVQAVTDGKLPIREDITRSVTGAGLTVRSEVVRLLTAYMRDLK